MNKQIILICGAILLLILFIGCTEFDKCDLDQDGTVDTKELNVCDQTKSINICGDKICNNDETIENCPQDCNNEVRGIKLNCQEGNYNSTTNTCEIIPSINYICEPGNYNPDTNQCEYTPPTHYSCETGTYNSNTNYCEYTPTTQAICTTGNYNSSTNKCEYNPTTQIICETGTLNTDNNTCEYNPQTTYTCTNGAYNPGTNQCEYTPTTQIICTQGIYNENTNTCEYTPPTQYNCEQGTYNEETQTCIYTPPIQPQTHLGCQNNSCVEIQGSGTNQCTNNADCTTEELPDVPWSMFFMHVEGIEIYNQCFDDIISLADEYNTPLTLMLWPQIRDLIQNDPIKLAKMQKWQKNGHEFGIHAQGCYGSDYCKDEFNCLQDGDAIKYENLFAPYELKTVHVAPSIHGNGEENECAEFLPDSAIYLGLGKFDGRTSITLQHTANEKTFHTLFIKAGFGTTPQRIQQYNTLNSDEIIAQGNHAECDTTYIEEWFQFLSEKDPEGLKRKTQSWLMENVILPKGRSYSIEEIENSTDPTVQQCTPLIGDKVFQDVYWYNATDVFNFGRCLNTQTYCYLNQSCPQEGIYFPENCEIKNITDLEGHQTINEMCPVTYGDNICSYGESRLDSQIYCPQDCDLKPPIDLYCGDGICDDKENKLGNCPEDCDVTTVVCGDGICDADTREKDTCPQDC